MTAKRSDLVPLADRQHGLEVFRLATVVLVLLVQWWAPEVTGASTRALLAGTVAYTAVLGAASVTWRVVRRRALWLFGAMLIADGLWLAWLAWLSGGLDGPLQSLLLLHLVTVALLAGYRTSMKLALWHSLLLVQTYFAEEAGLLPAAAAAPPTRLDDVGVFVAVFWLFAIGTATFSAINERELRRRRYDLEALAATAAALEAAASSQAAVDALLDGVTGTFDLRRAVLFIAPAGRLLPAASRGVPVPLPDGAPGPDSLVSAVASSRTTLLVSAPDPAADRWLRAAMPDARNLVAVPLLAEGRSVGVLVAEHGLRSGSRIERRVVSMLERFVSQGALALRGAWLFEQVQRLAERDGLTGVANRHALDRGLDVLLEQARQNGEDLTLVMVDLDHFKHINDSFGHAVGDDVLRAAARALDESCRAEDLTGRYGGEEFVVLRRGCGPAAGAIFGERLRRAVARSASEPPVTASIGVASYPADARDAASLLAAADAALYEAKRRGRNRVVTAAALAEEEHARSARHLRAVS